MENFPFEFQAAAHGNADAQTPVFERFDYSVCTIEYIVSGSGHLEVNGTSANPGPDDIYQLPKHSNHRYYPDRRDPWQKLFIVVDGDFMEELLRIHGLREVYHIRACRSLKHWFEHWVDQGSAPRSQEQYAVEFHQFVAELAAHVRRGNDRCNPYVRELHTLLQSGFGKPFSLSGYAASTPYTKEHLICLFREEYQVTPYEYRLRKKMEQARALLLNSMLSVKEIAEVLGFSSQYHFSNCFKARIGKSPSDFRKTI